jgi:hypothetical protein
LLEWVSISQGANPVKGDFGVVDKDFILLAGCTPFHVLSDPMVHPWPGEVILSLPDCFVLPRVFCCGVVVDQGHEVLLLGLGHSVDGDKSYEFLRQEYNYVSVILFSLVDGWGSREDVWPHVGFPRYVVDDEVILLQVCMPSGCSSVEVLWGLPVLKICVVHEDNEGKFGPS